ncbi:biopolymer transporter ExbB [Sulfitobacter sp. TSTF-M16]|uniref:Biopolymer transporter ExbB n=1 Tax=Sulfitobacter aestuariivivens TaxID=2766981 RepID=A0A927D3K0_9RHOB|nr:biopolymer transporter ExbB [Sulfitobacter aestuariivivens]MBD3664385.1 biopolymer transporter ExbB [Sulfitobacter aestuariivivens]
MAQPDQKSRTQFSQPVRQISLMLIVLALTGAGAFLALPSVWPIFAPNPWLNGVILMVFVIGVVACFYQVVQLVGSVRWIENFVSDTPDPDTTAPTMLAPLAALLRARGARMQVSSSSTRSILDSVGTRIDEAREITRYIVNMLIFLGLLGTFYGLATTVPAVVDTIRSLAPSEGEGGVAVFTRLMTGLEAQLGGMGVAFGSSLLGLAGSLVVGLLELFAGHGQNRFYQELEDWLSSITRVGFSAGDDATGEQQIMASVVDHMAEQMESLTQMLTQSDVSRAIVDEKLGKLADAVDRMTTRMELQSDPETNRGMAAALSQIAEGQERMIGALEARVEGEGIDAESRMRLRSIDVQMLRILEEISAGRQETMAELRNDISLLAKAMSGARESQGQPRTFRVTSPDAPDDGLS